MDASTFTAFRLDQQRAAELDREHALRVSHRQRHEATGAILPARRRVSAWFRRSKPVPVCDPEHLALAGPAA